MKSNFTVRLLCAALALSAFGLPARAQVANTFWSSIAAGCVLDRPDLAAVDANHGTVSFAARKSGVIKLTCPVTFAIQPSFAQILSFGLTFYNDHGFEGNVDHCVINAAFLRSNLNNVEGGLDIVDLGTSGRSLVGRQLLVSNAAPLMDFSTSYYWIYVQLSRDSVTATCNPTLVGTFLTANME